MHAHSNVAAGTRVHGEDGVSGQFDYSPQRIERLIEQGRQAAQRAIERPERSPAGVAEVRSARARR